jgi:hypothetical protein
MFKMNKIESQFGLLARFMMLMFSVLAVGCGGKDPILGSGGAAASLAPTVTATVPLAITPIITDVAINSKITATFSKDIAPATINNSTFTVSCPAGNAIAGTVSYLAASRVATFSPNVTLPHNTTCVATLTTAVKDTTGLSLTNAFVWSFVTSVAPDIIAPTVTLKVPAAGATNVAFNEKIIATFSEDMDPATITANTILLHGAGANVIAGSIVYAAGARTATFTPSSPSPLPASTTFTATVTTGAKDLAGNALANNAVWSFTTSVAPDITRPTVTLKAPDAGETNVAINSNVLITFSEDMDPATMTTANILVKDPSAALITGTVTYAVGAKTATFIPISPTTLPATTLLTVTVTSDAKDLAGNALAGDPAALPAASNAVWTFTTGVTPDTTRPMVTLKVPSVGATGIALNSMVTATFNEDMDPQFIRESSFTLKSGVTAISGIVSYAVGSRTAIFIPNSPLTSNTIYTATLTTNVRDLSGNTLAGDSSTPLVAANAAWTFTTGAAPDITPPTVTLKVPAAGDINVATNASVIVTFSEDMDPLTITGNTILLQGPGATAITGTITYAVGARTATFNPTSPATLPTGNVFTVIVTTGAKDLAGNALTNNASWTFSTGATPDTTRPTVTLKVPVAGATGVAFNEKVLITFSEDMDPATLNETNVTLTGPAATVITGTVTYAVGARTATFTPTIPATLPASTLFTATVTTGATDLAGNSLAANTAWTFATGATPDITPPTVTNKVPAVNAINVATNANVIATFSEDMDPLTITANTVILQGPGSTIIAGTVTYAVGAKTATFNPSTPLPTGDLFTVIVTTGAKDSAGNALTNNAVWTFSTGATPDTTRPTVTLKVPANGATGVALNQQVIATFSEDMDPATMVAANFSVTGAGGAAITGAVTYTVGARTITFTPNSTLPATTLLTATVTIGAKDLAGNTLAGDLALLPAASNAVWTFTTGAAPDTTRPTVTLKSPLAGATGVAFNAKVVATFSEDMDPATVSDNTILLQGPGANAITGTIVYAVGARTVTFTPTTPVTLPANTLFTATVTTGARDLAGNALLNNVVWTFSTGAAPDTTPPTVTRVNPIDLATGVCLQKTINATFSEAMDPFSLTTSTLTLKVSGGALAGGTVAYDALSKVATFNPTSDLLANTNYTATVTTGAKDLAGNGLVSSKIWTFTTGTQACATAVDLGTAAPFGNLGGAAGTTNDGILTVIGGDLGTTAVTTSAITGFHDIANDLYTETGSNQGAVNGKIYTCTVSTTGPTAAAVNAVACSVATQARSDAQTAFNKLAPGAMPGGTDPGAGQLGGLTLASGIYQAAGGSFLITGSDLTLDAQGDANAIWIFQTATTLTVGAPAAPRSIILINGAQAKNVFWRVGASATINAAGGGTMVGTIIASSAVSLSTVGNVALVTLNGRAMGLNASVTMTNAVINVPAP